MYRKMSFVLLFLLLGIVLILKTDFLKVSANELPISGFYDYDFTTKKEKQNDVTVPENSATELNMEGYQGSDTSVDTEEDISLMSVIGEDNRVKVTKTTSLPNRWIAYIVSYWPDGSATRGTAWLYGKSVGATAAHCIYSKEKQTYPVKMVIYPGHSDGMNPFGSYTITRASIPRNYKLGEGSKYDFGVFKVNSDVGSKLGYFRVQYSANTYTGKFVRITGYPADKGNGLWRDSGKIIKCENGRLYYKMDTYGGQSGSPIYFGKGTKRTCIGVHTTGGPDYNRGTRITKKMFYWMREKRQSWG